MFAAASETLSPRETSTARLQERLAGYRDLAAEAHQHGLRVRGYVYVRPWLPFRGICTAELRSLRVAHEALPRCGCFEVSLGDTIGSGTPETNDALLETLDRTRFTAGKLAVHFHDTGGRALDNIHVALRRGIRVIRARHRGAGRVSVRPGFLGNVATETGCRRPCTPEGFETGVRANRSWRPSPMTCCGYAGEARRRHPARRVSRTITRETQTKLSNRSSMAQPSWWADSGCAAFRRT